MRDWYEEPDGEQVGENLTIRWADILTHWLDVSLDLHEIFHIDTESGVLQNRSWWWLHDRIVALINKPSRLRASLEIPATAAT